MSLTLSTMLALGTAAPDFTLRNVIDNTPLTLSEYADGKPILIAFICNHCPAVQHILPTLVQLGNRYTHKGVAFIAISSNDIEQYEEDGPEAMQRLGKKQRFKFPYCYDVTQSVAKAYDAACTPDFYCFDRAHRLIYRGQFDGSRPGNNVPTTGEHLVHAMDAALTESPLLTINQKPSCGCNIKWKSDVLCSS